MFENFLKELAQLLEFPSLSPDEKGACLIIMKASNTPLLFELDEQLVPNKILISSEVLTFPLERRAEIYEECLKLNSIIEETVSVKPDEDVIYLHRRLTSEIQENELKVVIDTFLEHIQMTKQRIEKLLGQPAKHQTIPPSPSSIQIFPYKA